MVNKNNTKKVIARIKGGLGNQLFCYAAARRLAQVNNAELVLDNITGFRRDKNYSRQYSLDRFNISARLASPYERMEPFEKYQRRLRMQLSKLIPFENRTYLEQEGIDFDQRLLDFKLRKIVYIDGLWQSEKYFVDIESTIRNDLMVNPPKDSINLGLAQKISNCNSISLHIRWFDDPSKESSLYNVTYGYYLHAIQMMSKYVNNPHFFIFSDNIQAADALLSLPESMRTLVTNNQSGERQSFDLWLMTQCKHFIIANSTFSWWGAWLAENKDKIIINPNIKSLEGTCGWGFKGLIPENWITI